MKICFKNQVIIFIESVKRYEGDIRQRNNHHSNDRGSSNHNFYLESGYPEQQFQLHWGSIRDGNNFHSICSNRKKVRANLQFNSKCQFVLFVYSKFSTSFPPGQCILLHKIFPSQERAEITQWNSSNLDLDASLEILPVWLWLIKVQYFGIFVFGFHYHWV